MKFCLDTCRSSCTMPTKDKETSTIFLHKVTAEIHSHLKKHKKTNIDSMQKHTYWLGWKLPIHYTTQNILSIWNQQPSHISKQKFKSTIICWGPKNKQHKKIKQFNQNRGRSSGTSVGAKTFNTWILKNDAVHWNSQSQIILHTKYICPQYHK